MSVPAAPSDDLVNITVDICWRKLFTSENLNRNVNSESAVDLFRVRLHNRPLQSS